MTGTTSSSSAAGRTALVIGDVMGRGVRAAAVMGQLRAAVRAYARLDLPRRTCWSQLDGSSRDLGEDQIVTCVYAVFDPADQTLRYANAGHLPPLVRGPAGEVHAPARDGARPSEPAPTPATRRSSDSHRATRVVLYTDGLVEQRGQVIDEGIRALEAQLLLHADAPIATLPEALVGALRPEGTDDDVALLVTRVSDEPPRDVVRYRLEEGSVLADARRFVAAQLDAWSLPKALVEDITLTTNELVANALLHGAPPIDVRLVHTGSQVVFEVSDKSPGRPRRRRTDVQDEHGRGLHVVEALATDWGIRTAPGRKTVWCSHAIPPPEPSE